jgi:hypothetical protein
MKTKNEVVTARSAYNRYTAQFKEQASERAGRDGIPQGGAGFGSGRGDIVRLAGKASANGAAL